MASHCRAIDMCITPRVAYKQISFFFRGQTNNAEMETPNLSWENDADVVALVIHIRSLDRAFSSSNDTFTFSFFIILEMFHVFVDIFVLLPTAGEKKIQFPCTFSFFFLSSKILVELWTRLHQLLGTRRFIVSESSIQSRRRQNAINRWPAANTIDSLELQGRPCS